MGLIKKYRVKNSILRHFIKFYWLMESDSEITIDNKLLPVNNTDIIIPILLYMKKRGRLLFPAGFILTVSEAGRR